MIGEFRDVSYIVIQQFRNNTKPLYFVCVWYSLFYQEYSSSINSFLSLLALSRDARFSGQDLWNGTLYGSILAYASIYSPGVRLGSGVILFRKFRGIAIAPVMSLQDVSKVWHLNIKIYIFFNFSQIFYFHSNYAEQNSVVLQFDYFNIILQIYYIRFHLRLFSHFTMHFCDKIKIMSIAF